MALKKKKQTWGSLIFTKRKDPRGLQMDHWKDTRQDLSPKSTLKLMV